MLQEEESWGGVKDGNYNMKKIKVAGLGPGNPDYILPAVRKAAEDSDIIIGGRRNIESIKELLEGKEGDFFGPAGYCVPPMYRQGLAAAMDKMCESRSLRLRMGANGQNRVNKYYRHERMMKEYKKFVIIFIGQLVIIAIMIVLLVLSSQGVIPSFFQPIALVCVIATAVGFNIYTRKINKR